MKRLARTVFLAMSVFFTIGPAPMLAQTVDRKAGGPATSAVGQVGQRQNKASVQVARPSVRIENRIANRVRNRVENRVDRAYIANAAPPIERAAQSLESAPPR